jgi:hypothetical protein
MINKIKSYALSIVAVLTFMAPTLVPVMVHADATSGCSGATGNSIASGANLGGTATVSCNGSTGVSSNAIANDAKKIVTLFSIIVGAVSVIMIIYGGFRYITSGGDSGRVGNAKNTLIYAIVGLVIVALAQLIVHFVLQQTSTVTTQS